MADDMRALLKGSRRDDILGDALLDLLYHGPASARLTARYIPWLGGAEPDEMHRATLVVLRVLERMNWFQEAIADLQNIRARP